MRLLVIIFAAAILSLFSTNVVLAADTPAVSAQINSQNTNSQNTNSQANASQSSSPDAPIQAVKSFINGFSDMIGGFVFYTPDIFSDNITLKDGTKLAGLGHFRDMFFALSIPIVALIVSFLALKRIGSEQPGSLRPFLMRLLICAALVIVTPTVLSLSIQANNLLVNQIQNEDSYGTFINQYLDQASTQIRNGEDPAKTGSFSQNRSIGTFFVQAFLFALTFLFFLFGFIFIAFQFVIRFASLLFLSVLFPLVIPFVLSEKTEGIVNTYFRSWFTFLIHQPAFVLGYVLAINLFRNMMEANGASLGILFLYTGFLLFLGGVNMIVARIFGESWTALATNVTAAIGSYEAKQLSYGKIGDFKKGLLGGQVTGLSSYLGRRIGNKYLPAGVGGNFSQSENQRPNNEGGGGSRNGSSASNSSSSSSSQPSEKSAAAPKEPPYTSELNTKGFKTSVENQKQGVVTVNGEGYQYSDKKSGLTSIYPTKADALTDGIKEEKLEPVKLNDDRFIDLSSFSRKNPNPHNAYATNEAKRKNLPSSHAHLTHTSSPDRVKNFLDLAEERNEPLGIKGVIVKRFGNKNSKERVIRLYKKENK